MSIPILLNNTVLKTPALGELNNYIRFKQLDCGNFSVNGTLFPNKQKNTNPVTQNDNWYLILVVKTDFMISLGGQTPIEKLQNITNYDEIIIGSSMIFVDDTRKQISIYDVCSHHLNTKGYGNEIFASIKTEIETTFGTDYYMWLSIDINNINFDAILHLYTSFGFGSITFNNHFFEPVITTQNPFEEKTLRNYFSKSKVKNELPFFYIVSLYALPNNIINKKDTKNMFHYVKYLVTEFKKFQHNDDINYSKLIFNIEKTTLEKFKRMPYMGIYQNRGEEGKQLTPSPNQEEKVLIGIPDGDEQFVMDDNEIEGVKRETYFNHEFFGVLTISEMNMIDGKYVFTISDSTTKDIIGKRYSVNSEDTQFSFHSHPLSVYKTNNLLINPPSNTDLKYLLFLYSKKLLRIHFITTVEGLYVISLNSKFLSKFAKSKNGNMESIGRAAIEVIKNNVMGRALHSYDWNAPDFNYMNYINFELNYYKQEMENMGIKNIFDIQFFPVSYLKDTLQIEVNIPTYYGNSLLTNNIAFIEQMYRLNNYQKTQIYTGRLIGTIPKSPSEKIQNTRKKGNVNPKGLSTRKSNLKLHNSTRKSQLMKRDAKKQNLRVPPTAAAAEPAPAPAAMELTPSL